MLTDNHDYDDTDADENNDTGDATYDNNTHVIVWSVKNTWGVF